MRTHPTLVSDNLVGLKEKTAVLQIHHLSLQSILDNINQSQFICQLLQNNTFTFSIQNKNTYL